MKRISPRMHPIASLLIIIALIGAMNLSCENDRRLLSDNKIELPQAAQLRSATASVDGRVDLIWTENYDASFMAYEIYRSETMPVTRGATRLLHTRDRQLLSFVDTTAKTAKTYYYKVYTLLDDGRMDSGTDKEVRIPVVTDPGISGTISRDMIWDLATSPVLVKGDLTIAAGARLTIMPGVVVKFAGSDSMQSGRQTKLTELIVEGTLVIPGENGNPVRLTSASPVPEKGIWGGIWFHRASGGSNSRLDYCQIEYAVDGIRLDDSILGMYRCRLERLGLTGLDMVNSRVSVADTIFHDIGSQNAGFGVRTSGAADLRMTNCLINGVQGTGVWMEGGTGDVHNAVIANCSLLGVAASDEILPALGELIVYECTTGLGRTTAEGNRQSDYNNIWFATGVSGRKAYQYITAGTHDKSEFPKFLAPDWGNPSLGDFRLEAGVLSTAGSGGSPMGLFDATRLGFKL